MTAPAVLNAFSRVMGDPGLTGALAVPVARAPRQDGVIRPLESVPDQLIGDAKHSRQHREGQECTSGVE